jgi:hypothetical protein
MDGATRREAPQRSERLMKIHALPGNLSEIGSHDFSSRQRKLRDVRSLLKASQRLVLVFGCLTAFDNGASDEKGRQRRPLKFASLKAMPGGYDDAHAE